MVNLLIVSKNRPCQLDLFFRSLIKNFKLSYNATVIYTYSNDFYKQGYDIILNDYKNKFHFIKETDFKKNVLSILDKKYKYFTCMGDDVVVYDKIEKTKEFEIFDTTPSILAINYRMGPNIDIVFQGKPPEQQPKFIKNRIWNWKKAKSLNWHYPMALMSQFYRTSDLLNYVPALNFTNPTMFEAAMIKQPLNKPFMMCFKNSKVIELAVNRVQNISKTNKAGNISTEKLNKLWLSGKRIKIEPLYKLPKNINRFYDIVFEYEKR